MRNQQRAEMNRLKIGAYVLGKSLGVGSFGKVKLAEHFIAKQLVAIKLISRNKISEPGLKDKVSREVRILQKLSHPHIVRLYDVVETPSHFFLVMLYASKGELFDYIVQNKLSDAEAKKIFQQIVSAIAYCHENHVSHRDLKPENILLTQDNNIKVADFGLSNLIRDGSFLRTSCGSPNYAAPEVISGLHYTGPEIDIWSIGVILYALLCSALPFHAEDIPKLFKKIKSGLYHLPSDLHPLAKNLIPKMLLVEPLRRIDMEGIMSHPWFSDDLPAYLAEPLKEQRPDRKEVLDLETVNHVFELVQSFGEDNNQAENKKISLLKLVDYVDKTGCEGIIRAIRSPVSNELKTMYDLLSDKKELDKIKEQSSSTNLKALQDFPQNKSIYDRINESRYINEGSESGDNGEEQDSFETAENGHLSDRQRRSTKSLMNDTYEPANGSKSLSNIRPDGLDKLSMKRHSSVRPGDESGYDPLGRSLQHKMRIIIDSGDIKRRKWYLGIQSKKDPELVMNEVFRVLGVIGCKFGTLSNKPYSVDVIWRVKGCDEIVYLRLQLYQVQSPIFLLDFQRGSRTKNSLRFLQLCGMIINCLKPPQAPRTTTNR
eukprot:snap_masked-scaffold_14-processed-gene-3.24-mRNA-1 protein AED:0.00 eAED:0.00 QI:0/-1/0/1/-1/1/1/0/599